MQDIERLLELSKVTFPIVEGNSAENTWGVSLGGFNPTAEHYFPCPDEETAWRLHDAIYILIMSTAPNLSEHASLASISQSMPDQMFLRQGIWIGFGLPQEIPCVGRKD
jgi:hypothetical protein